MDWLNKYEVEKDIYLICGDNREDIDKDKDKDKDKVLIIKIIAIIAALAVVFFAGYIFTAIMHEDD